VRHVALLHARARSMARPSTHPGPWTAAHPGARTGTAAGTVAGSATRPTAGTAATGAATPTAASAALRSRDVNADVQGLCIDFKQAIRKPDRDEARAGQQNAGKNRSHRFILPLKSLALRL
jgi:hypothetical protein